MVLVGLVTAWRLASWPTSRSPLLLKATTDGTVRPPSADAMTVGSPPSITATTEFVVPRSMPMILPMVAQSPSMSVDGWVFDGLGIGCGLGARLLGDGHHRRADDAVPEPVPAPELLDDLTVPAPAVRDVHDRLVLARVELDAG